MFSKHLSLTSIIFGIILLAVYIIVMLYKKRTSSLQLADGVIVFISGTAIIAGIKVMLMAVDEAIPFGEDVNRVYIFLGSLAVAWVSIADFNKKLK